MASGLPVVAGDQAAHRHVIQHEREGLLVAPGDPRPLADAILRVLDQPEFAQMIAERARRRVSDEFAVGKMAEEHLELFRQLMVQRAS